MAEFKKLSDVEIIETPIDTANVLIEEDGVIKRVPKDEVGGIKVAAAEVGQTIVVKAVDENGNPTEWEAVDLPEGASSWNDLKDRPFYEEVKESKYYYWDEQEITFGSETNGYTYAEAAINEQFPWSGMLFVNFDDIEYECEIYDTGEYARVIFNVNGDDISVDFGGTVKNYERNSETAGRWANTTHIISVYSKSIEETVKPLDTKYLPEALQIGEKEVVMFDGDVTGKETDGYYDFSEPLPLKGDTLYKVKFDNIEFTSKAIYDSDDQTWLLRYEVDGGRILAFYPNGFSLGQGVTKHFYISELAIKQLDEKFIKDALVPKLGPFFAASQSGSSTSKKSAVTTGDYHIKTLEHGVMVNVFFYNKNTAGSFSLNVDDTGDLTVELPENSDGSFNKGIHSFVYNSTGVEWIMIN